ncbi:hypothetical protein [Vibrio campbellii]|uniref:hypothetical protein n=1 Tax=Vibrio campbellii TaxID=680 RepID=UPI003F84B17F
MIKQSMDTYYTTRFLNLLRKNFTQWKAYQLGIIDSKGNLLRKPQKHEKQYYTRFDALVRGIKVKLEKIGGKHAGKAFAVSSLFSEANLAGDHGYNADNIASGASSGNAVTKQRKRFKDFATESV